MTWFHGFISGSLSTIVVWPLETLRIQKQTSSEYSRSILYFSKTIMKKQGIKGFYKGLPYGIFSKGIFYGIYFNLYEHLYNNHNKKFISSYLSANVASLICNPLYVMQVRRQTILHRPLERCYSCREIIYREGYRMLFRGFGFTCIKNVEIGFIPPLRDKFDEYGLNRDLATFSAKLLVLTFTYPLDTLRNLKRLKENPMSTYNIFKMFFKNPQTMFQGYITYAMRSIPATVIAFTLQDWFVKNHL